MTPEDFRLYDVFNCLADAVDETAGDPDRARAAWHEGRNAAAAYAAAAPPEVRQELGMLVNASKPDRARASSVAVLLSNALHTAAGAALIALTGDRDATVQANTDAAFAAEHLDTLRPAFEALRGETCELARQAAARQG